MTPLTGDPLHVIHTLVFQPADFNPTFATKPAAQIKAPPGITTSALDMQFRHLLEEPLLELAKEHDLGPVVIVLDALNECGTAETRKELLHTLFDDLARLPSMFRLLISRQDSPWILTFLTCGLTHLMISGTNYAVFICCTVTIHVEDPHTGSRCCSDEQGNLRVPRVVPVWSRDHTLCWGSGIRQNPKPHLMARPLNQTIINDRPGGMGSAVEWNDLANQKITLPRTDHAVQKCLEASTRLPRFCTTSTSQLKCPPFGERDGYMSQPSSLLCRHARVCVLTI